MEREEAELLQRLRLSQERHRMAYMQLEDVIRGQGASLESAGLPGLPPFSQPWDHQTATPSSSRRNAESPAASRPTSQAGLERVEGMERLAFSKPPLPRAPPGARPRSGARSKPQVLAPTTPPDAVDQLRNLHSKSAMSNASTTSVGETSIVHSPGAYEGSGQSTSIFSTPNSLHYCRWCATGYPGRGRLGFGSNLKWQMSDVSMPPDFGTD